MKNEARRSVKTVYLFVGTKLLTSINWAATEPPHIGHNVSVWQVYGAKIGQGKIKSKDNFDLAFFPKISKLWSSMNNVLIAGYGSMV